MAQNQRKKFLQPRFWVLISAVLLVVFLFAFVVQYVRLQTQKQTLLNLQQERQTLMDEVSETAGQADTADTKDYKNRVLPILNVLRWECFPCSDTYAVTEAGKRPVCPEISDFDSPIALDDVLCQGVLPYGLAAHLLLDENPAAASYFQQRYEELLRRAKQSIPAVSEDIADVYGGIEHGRYGRW